jgi:hypothetical protein
VAVIDFAGLCGTRGLASPPALFVDQTLTQPAPEEATGTQLSTARLNSVEPHLKID